MNKFGLSLSLFIMTALILISFPDRSIAGSKYERILRDPEGKRKLGILAGMEEDRVLTDDIRALIRDPDPLIRLRSAEVLGRVDYPIGTVFYLTKLVKDEDDAVAGSAIYSLGLVGYREETRQMAVEALGACLKEGNPGRKLLALDALGRTRSSEAASLIKPYLKNFHSSLRAEAALALSLLGDSTQAKACALSLSDPQPAVTAMAAYTIGRLGYPLENHRLIALMESEDREVRLRASEALGRLKEKKAIERLAWFLTGDDRMLAVKAAEALGRIGGKKSAEKLEKALSLDDSYLKTLALEGIQRTGNKKSFSKVLPLLNDKSLMTRVAAIKAAAETGGSKARIHLLEKVKSGTPYEKMTALEFLGEIGIEEDIGLLTDILSSATGHLSREGAAAGLGRWKNTDLFTIPCGDNQITPAKALVDAANGDDRVIATIAIESIGNTIPAKAIDDLSGIFNKSVSREDSDKKLAIIRILGAFGDNGDMTVEQEPGIKMLLKTALVDPDPRVREASAEAAGRFGLNFSPDPTLSSRWIRGDLPRETPPLPSGDRKISIVTAKGNIEITLFGDDAPGIVAAILTLVQNGFYDGLNFHRVVPGFVIQGGCPRGDGWGDAGFFLRSEFNMHRYGRGYVGVAHSGKDTPGSQFFITHTPQPHLDGRYTVIGIVTDGMEVVDRIEIGDSFRIRMVE
ncbi:MAG: HEAT repeat domain-containing protein [Candidatus Krumholzibacteriota bacterium]|nr:HEAT repeat domain-containing protein [Candidatus Krumholzibacteriota bacterium]